MLPVIHPNISHGEILRNNKWQWELQSRLPHLTLDRSFLKSVNLWGKRITLENIFWTGSSSLKTWLSTGTMAGSFCSNDAMTQLCGSRVVTNVCHPEREAFLDLDKVLSGAMGWEGREMEITATSFFGSPANTDLLSNFTNLGAQKCPFTGHMYKLGQI